MKPKNLLACQIVYSSIEVRCEDHRTKTENLKGAWNLLVSELRLRGWAIPNSREAFVKSGGKVSFYTSY